ncbi:MAG: ABC transporter ATP-binding protein/permease [Streptococcaceae bacterium]|jgi:ATP-binding cassette subfamily B multidrug efflux pump|nr:ABC transporter ATP-binding protein/permease [Streptococcaceae bacterium]
MSDTRRALRFFYLYLKKYKIQWVAIVVFVIAATWLQVQSPIIMGDAITNLSQYVIQFFQHQAAPGLKKMLDSMAPLINQAHLPGSTKFADVFQMAHQTASSLEMPVKEFNQLSAMTIDQATAAAVVKAPSTSMFMNGLWKLLLFYVMTGVSMLIYSLLFTRIIAHSTNRMRKGLFGKLERLTIAYFDRHADGDILSRFTSDLDNIQNSLNQSAVSVVSNFAMFVGVLYMMIDKNLQATGNIEMALVVMAAAIVAIPASIIIVIQAKKNTDRQQNEVGQLNAYMDEKISGQKAIIVEGLEDETIKDFEPKNQKVQKATFRAQAWSGMIFPIMNGFQLVAMSMVIFLGARILLNDKSISTSVALGLLVTFITYSQQFYNPIMQISSSFGQLQLAITGATRLNILFDEPEEVRPKNGVKLNKLTDNVKIENLDFEYIPGEPVLKNVNIEVDKGQMVALVGPTGSGKTTVMNLMNRFYDVTSGSIKIDGVDVRDYDLDSLRSKVGIVLQESTLFDGTIAENIAFGKPEASMDEIITAAKTTHIHPFIDGLPEGYETHVNDDDNVFSVGQKQQISIARTILTNPELLILDEATSNVDTVTEQLIQWAMEAAIAGRTSFVIAHRLKTILNADKIIVLKDGQVIEQGTHHELVAENGFYAELYHNQFVFE